MTRPDLSDEAADLYGSSLEEFTDKRNALAKRLRASGDTDQAGIVQKLQKPKLSAWAVDQIARSEDAKIRDLLETTELLERARSRAELRAATERRQALVAALTEKAAEVLDAAGHRPSAGTLEEVRRTLHSATSEEDRILLQRGVLAEPIEASGFGLPATGDVDVDVEDGTFADPERDRMLAKLQKDLERAKREVERREREVERARELVDRAETRTREASEHLARVEAEIDRLI